MLFRSDVPLATYNQYAHLNTDLDVQNIAPPGQPPRYRLNHPYIYRIKRQYTGIDCSVFCQRAAAEAADTKPPPSTERPHASAETEPARQIETAPADEGPRPAPSVQEREVTHAATLAPEPRESEDRVETALPLPTESPPAPPAPALQADERGEELIQVETRRQADGNDSS